MLHFGHGNRAHLLGVHLTGVLFGILGRRSAPRTTP